MLHLILYTLLAMLQFSDNARGSFPSYSSSEPHSRVKRVVGGQTIRVEELPYMVNIRRNGVFECGGTLVTPRCVLTAAHCIKDGQPQEFNVRGGITHLYEHGKNRGVHRIIQHHSFDRKSFEADVAIFLLTAPLRGRHIETIPLSGQAVHAGDFVQIAGWGMTSEQATEPSKHLRTAKLQVLPQRACRTLYSDYRNVTATMFCAAIPGQRDACMADSGGPALLDGKLVGVVSWGRGYECGRVQSPGVYVRIAELRNWLASVLKEYCY